MKTVLRKKFSAVQPNTGRLPVPLETKTVSQTIPLFFPGLPNTGPWPRQSRRADLTFCGIAAAWSVGSMTINQVIVALICAVSACLILVSS
jgi:hypothetical protein